VIEVLSAGLLTTVQDLGRPGYAALGIAAGGAADPLALRLGNRLVGNPEGAPALEMTQLGASLRFHDPAWVAFTGAAGVAADVPLWTCFPVAAGEVLRGGAMRDGVRSYLCVAGGLQVPQVLGSAATLLRSGLGGLDGRALRRGDVLAVAPGPRPRLAHIAAAAVARLYPAGQPRVFRVTDGPQRDLYSQQALSTLLSAEYVVSEQSDRLGVRLAGPPVQRAGPELLTEGVFLGAVQIPADGQPIVLGVDQQTTGGYPKPVAVIATDLPRLGQLRPGDRVRFVPVSLEQADALHDEQAQILSDPALLVA
jgi:antagonist of KipI